MARTQTRSALLDAALEAFAAKGFDGASIREITRVVGVRESAFYAHFPGKRAAYDELFAESGPPVVGRALEMFSTNLPPPRFLARFAAAIIDAWSAPRARKFAAMMMRDAFDNEAQGWRMLRTSVDGVRALLVKRFDAWKSAGLVRKDCSSQALAFDFIAPIAMVRFLHFNLACGKAEAARGRAIVAEHARVFAKMIEV